MTATGDDSSAPAWRAIPRWVWVVACLAGVLHMLPAALADLRTPAGWTFTGNVSGSPDYMQYRTWSRQTLEEGPVVSNRFTAEPNARYLPVPAYWVIGQLSRLTGVSPEWVNAWLGVPLAMALVLLLFMLVRTLLPHATAIRWTLGALLLGGGLGGFLVLVRETSRLRDIHALYVLIAEPLEGGRGQVAPFEDYRGNYILQALLDTHFLTYWVVSLAAVLILFAFVRQPSRRRLAALALAVTAATVVHVYEGVTLMAVATGAAVLAWRRGLSGRDAIRMVAAPAIGVAACFVGVAFLARAAHLPAPTWRGLAVPPLIVLLGYPVAWLLIAGGGLRYWLEARREEAALIGWALGCLALLLSGPFFPYPDRGTMTLQVPLMVIAASIYFRTRTRVPPRDVLLLVALSGSTLAFLAYRQATRDFDPAAAYSWIQPAHREVIDSLVAGSGPDDLLLADEVSLRWLGPEYRGRHHAGHFFLTVRYQQKRAALEAFLLGDDVAAQRSFLHETGATWLFVPAERQPERLAALPELHPVVANAVGTLFRVLPAGSSGPAEANVGGR